MALRCVALEHLQRLVTGHRCDLHHVQALLEEATRGFMPQIVQAQAAVKAAMAAASFSLTYN